MKKKLLTLSVAAVMTVSMAMPALADDAVVGGAALGNVATVTAGSVEAVKNVFTDVAAADYFYQPVLWAVEKKITTGATPTTFEPHENCTKAQILTFLYRAAGEPAVGQTNPFKDISEKDYFYKAALWAAENKLVDGEEFLPQTACTRAAAVEYIWKQAGSKQAKASAGFTDVDGEVAKAADWAKEAGVTTGATATTFEPQNICTRAQIASFLYRAFADADKAAADDTKADTKKEDNKTGGSSSGGSSSGSSSSKKDDTTTEETGKLMVSPAFITVKVAPVDTGIGGVAGTLQQGQEFTLMSESNGWALIKGFDTSNPEKIGFVPLSLLNGEAAKDDTKDDTKVDDSADSSTDDSKTEDTTEKVMTADTMLTVYVAPVDSLLTGVGGIAGTVAEGHEFIIISESNGWATIKGYDDADLNKIGFVPLSRIQ